MRRLSLSLSMLALAGLLLAACDFRREQEVGEPTSDESSHQDPSGRDAFILYTHAEYSLQRDVQHLRLSDITGGNPREVPLPAECPEPVDFRLNPNGSVLALTCNVGDSPLGLFDLDSFDFRLISAGTFGAGQWSHDGQRLAYLERRTEPEPNRLHIIRVDGSDDGDYGAAPGALLGWTPANQIIFGNVFDPCLDPAQPCVVRGELFNPATGERTRIRNVVELGPWSPDGKRVLGLLQMEAPERPPGTGWPFVAQVIDSDTDERHVVSFGSFNVYPLAWMPDGKAFFVNALEMTPPFTSGKCLVWRINAADVADRALIAEDACPIAHLSRDQQRLWFTSHPDPTEMIPGFQSELWMLDISSGSRILVIPNARQYIVWEPPEERLLEGSPTQSPLPQNSSESPDSATTTSSPINPSNPPSTAPISPSATPASPTPGTSYSPY